jgi:CheY-like chemotaxis protein
VADGTVLVADDDADVRGLVRALIEDMRYEVIEAEDGEEAWSLLLANRPHLAILDVSMPGRTGLQLAHDISAEPLLQATRVVLLTGVDPVDLPRLDEATGPRIDMYVQKPFAPSMLRQVIAAELLR